MGQADPMVSTDTIQLQICLIQSQYEQSEIR